MRLIWLGLAALLTACQSGPITAPDQRAVARLDLTEAQREAVHAGVRHRLKDPASAMFGPVVAGRRSDGRIPVCGYVNARNSFGGYTGSRVYTGFLPIIQGIALPASVAAFGEDATGDTIVRRMCAEMGLLP